MRSSCSPRTASRPRCASEAKDRGLRTIDATCPLVTKVHQEAKRFAREDYDILLVGHHGHEEVEGTAGEAPEHIQLVETAADVADVTVRDPEKVVWLSQTTLSVDETMETVRALRERFPSLQNPPSDDICYATQNRQVAVKAMAPQCDLVLVVGSQELVELGAARRGGAARPAPGRRTSSTTPARSTTPGSTASPRSVSPAARPCPRCWCAACSTTSPSAAGTSVEEVTTAEETLTVLPAPRAAPRAHGALGVDDRPLQPHA